jgi:4-oxalomesaconate hydratase
VSERLLAVGAHAADFVWRAGGVLALTSRSGGTASVLSLSYGERGESGELWKEPAQTVENVKRIRHEEAERAAAALGAGFQCLDLGDYPLEVEGDALSRLVDAIREAAPDTIVTHTDRDPFNPDHPVAFAAVERARALAAGAGAQSYFRTYYGQRAEQRANHARRVSGNKEIRYAEAFMRVLPQVLTEL